MYHILHYYYSIKRSPLSHCKCNTFRFYKWLFASVIVFLVVISDIELVVLAEHAVNEDGSNEDSA